ncbi:MAG: ABC transporter substrate-binding protein [Lachnospiraceae bacterium]|nr:ABC transporter substrate-binding protein [Lachnospiraceae bacterium]
MKKRFLSFFLAVLTMTTLGACQGSTAPASQDKPDASPAPTMGTTTEVNSSIAETEPEPVYGGSMVVGIQQDIDSLDPHKATAAGTKEILFNIFEGLVKPDENGNLICAVASDYTVSDDGLVYTFTLRDGVKFHNGADVAAEDVKYSLERASGLLDGTPLISVLSAITDVTILDEKTVQVTLGAPNPELIYSFTVAIIPNGSGEDAEASPIGTGPFAFEAYTPQEGIVLKKNESYWQEGLPYLDEVKFKIVSSSDTALLELKTGSIDIYPYLTDSQAAELESVYKVQSAPSNVVQALFLNNAVEPLNDKKVRQAICYALDKDAINDFVSGGKGTIVSSAMLPTLTDFYEDLNSTYGTGANVEKAKKLLSEAGYADGFDLEIMIPSNYEFHMQTGEVVAEQLKEVGINATINPVEWNTWLSDCYTDRKYQASICGFTCDMTPGYLLNRFRRDSKKNFINFDSAEYDEVYASAQEANNMKDRTGYYIRLQEILTEEAGTAFIQIPPVTTAIGKDVYGYRFYPVYVQDMSTVFKGTRQN